MSPLPVPSWPPFRHFSGVPHLPVRFRYLVRVGFEGYGFTAREEAGRYAQRLGADRALGEVEFIDIGARRRGARR